MMVEWTGNRFLKTFATLLCVAGLFGQTPLNAQGPGGGGGPGPQLSLCYIDGTENCADVVLHLYSEGLYPSDSFALSCGGCAPPPSGGVPMCENGGKSALIADASTLLPFATSVPGFPGGNQGGNDVTPGNLVDCGFYKYCSSLGCERIGGVWSCRTAILDDDLPAIERSAAGDPCTAEVQ